MACQTSSHTKNSCNGYEWKIVSLYEDVIDQMIYLFFSFNALYLVKRNMLMLEKNYLV